MKRSVTIFTAIASLLLVGLLLLLRFASHPSHTKPTEDNAATAAGITSPARTVSLQSEKVQPTETRLQLPDPNSWHDRLLNLQSATNELFGPSGEERMKELQEFAESLPADELPDALRELEKLQAGKPTIAGRDLQMRLLRRWADDDPRSAAAWAMQMPDDFRRETLTAAADIWARKDLSEAAAWAKQLPAGADRQSALKSIASETLFSNPTDALNLAAQMPADPERDDLIARAAGAWAARAPADATAWAKQLPDADARQKAIADIAITWADRDPISAGNLVIDSLPAGKAQEDTVLAILRRWSLKDEKAAGEWVAQFPNGELRTLALETLATDTKRLSAVLPAE